MVLIGRRVQPLLPIAEPRVSTAWPRPRPVARAEDEDALCPITWNAIKDIPVAERYRSISDGQTYDRAALKTWLELHGRSPWNPRAVMTADALRLWPITLRERLAVGVESSEPWIILTLIAYCSGVVWTFYICFHKIIPARPADEDGSRSNPAFIMSQYLLLILSAVRLIFLPLVFVQYLKDTVIPMRHHRFVARRRKSHD